MRTELVEDALRNVATTTVIEAGAIFHFDRESVGLLRGGSAGMDR
jgi:hypothetical protein